MKDLWGQFGNLGLAAAAYNAGPRRVREWLDGDGNMPGETRNYVSAVTGVTVDDWAAERKKTTEKTEDKKVEAKRIPGCGELMAMLKKSPTPFMENLTKRVVQALSLPWGVQLAAGFSRETAMASYARALRRFGGVLFGQGSRHPVFASAHAWLSCFLSGAHRRQYAHGGGRIMRQAEKSRRRLHGAEEQRVVRSGRSGLSG